MQKALLGSVRFLPTAYYLF